MIRYQVVHVGADSGPQGVRPSPKPGPGEAALLRMRSYPTQGREEEAISTGLNLVTRLLTGRGGDASGSGARRTVAGVWRHSLGGGRMTVGGVGLPLGRGRPALLASASDSASRARGGRGGLPAKAPGAPRPERARQGDAARGERLACTAGLPWGRMLAGAPTHLTRTTSHQDGCPGQTMAGTERRTFSRWLNTFGSEKPCEGSHRNSEVPFPEASAAGGGTGLRG